MLPVYPTKKGESVQLVRGMVYKRAYRIGEFEEGGYTYRFCEGWVYEREEKAKDGEGVQAIYFCDIEIFDGSGYYYVYLGDKNNESPEATRELVASFTLKSFD